MAIFDEFPYTNFHDKNLDGMCKAIGENRNQIELNKNKIGLMKLDLDRIDALTQEMHGQVSRHELALNAQAQRLTTLELDDQKHTRDIAELDGEVEDHEDRITALEQGGGGGGGGFTWGTAELILQGGQRVPIKFNFDVGMFIIPDTSSLACSRNPDGSTGNPVIGIDIISGQGAGTIPMTFYLKYVIPMTSGDIEATASQYFTISAQWTIKFNGETAESCRCNPVTYSAFSHGLIRGQLVTFPIFGVCY